MLVVSYEVAHALNQRAGRLGILPHEFSGQRMKVYGQLMEHGEVVHHPKVVDEGDELARCFVIRASAREALEEHATSEAIRRAAATRFPVDEDIRARYQTPPRQTSGNGNARTTSGTHGFDWTSRSKWLVSAVWWTGILVPLNTCEESHRTKRIALGLDGDSWMSCSGQPGRYRKNYKDLTSWPGPGPPAEVPTETTKGTGRAVTMIWTSAWTQLSK